MTGNTHTGKPTYEFRVIGELPAAGWYQVSWRFAHGSHPWETVARVFGLKRAEIVRDALAAEANEQC